MYKLTDTRNTNPEKIVSSVSKELEQLGIDKDTAEDAMNLLLKGNLDLPLDAIKDENIRTS